MEQSNQSKSSNNIGRSVLLLSVICVVLTYIPYSISLRRSDEEWIFVLPFAYTLAGVLPAGIVFYLSEVFLKRIFNFENKKILGQLAIVCGFTVGLVLVLLTNFFLWKYSNSTRYYVPFSEFLFPESISVFFDFAVRVNPFSIISIINIVSSTYMGWKINEARNLL